ncbi:autotransporter-associated beta strand repeat-containing protein [Luteolibacter yonseiensis]|uniref:Autotransporter-associated beta strand repeat-containing protein n=1 Tax=Luteolibacter yonseiensis TaxID=1144680 RepID=A0A934V8I6_9BACT|nr:autotransporter-associated beta strand repeat-containing protein [Luteolibacter yonseiensis]MBK1817297.1 autotransporter-associated beta strand repeat-containing protein [Luteolibacter yonseiensis]
MNNHRLAAPISYCMLLCLQAVQGVEIPKLFNNTALNLPGAWTGNVVPGPSDVAVWNDQGPPPVNATGNLSPLGGDLSISGIKVTNVTGTRNAATTYTGYNNASSTNTLTIGAGGIDSSTATQTFYGSSKITLGADQTWNVANANTNGNPASFNNNEDIVFQALAAAAPFNLGGRTLTTTGAGQITISSGYTVSNGTLTVGNNLFVIQGGSSRLTTLGSNLNLVVNSGSLRLQSNSGNATSSLDSAAPATVNAGTFELYSNNPTLSLAQTGNVSLNQGSILSFNLVSGGPISISGAVAINGATTIRTLSGGNPANGALVSGNLSGAGAVTYQNTANNSTTPNLNGNLNLTGNNSGYTGVFSINGASGNRKLRISGANSGSAAATWDVAANNILQIHGVSPQLGTITGAGSITNSSTTAPATLNVGAGSFSGVISDGTDQKTALNKIGTGKLTLSGANTYSGTTTVAAGHLELSSSQLPLSPADFTVADAATLTVRSHDPSYFLQAHALTVGTTAGATLEIALGANSNPESPVIVAENLLVNGPVGPAGPNTLAVSGSNLSTGAFPLIEYTTLGGTKGFDGLSLKLPPRTTGSLTHTTGAIGTIGVNIASTEQIKWMGNISTDWDIDPDGTGTVGTPNWKTTVTNASTRYLQGTGGTDVVTFDDTASGTGVVNVTTTVSPVAITVNNTDKAYAFGGPGKITGATGITKNGTNTLTISTPANDYQGGTVINAGTLRLGDGVTVGGGSITGSIVNSGTLVLNRPDDHVLTNTITGEGTLEKAANNTVTIGSVNTGSPHVLTAGKLLFNNGGSLFGVISGAGQLQAGGGTLSLGGTEPNSNTGLVTVSAGALRLEKTAGINAVGGDITTSGTGTLAIISSDQIPDTATINVLGSSTDSLVNSIGNETFANANLNGTSADTQMVLRNLINITGTATVTQGILGAGSGATVGINSIVLTSPTAFVRIAGNTANSTMNVGAGGITASAGEIQVKYNGSNFDSILNLTGGVTTTGNLNFTNGAYTGASLNVINLMEAAHTFDIGAATTTTVAPDLGGTGSLVKSGTGTLTLNASCVAAHTGGTSVNQGTLLVNGSLQGTGTVAAAGTIGGTGTLAGTVTVDGTVAPGVTAGKLTTAAITLAPGSALAVDVASWTGTTPGTDWDQLAADTLTLSATSGNKLTVRVKGTPTGFTETAKTLAIATSINALNGFDPSAVQVDATGFSGAGTWTVQKTGNTLELVYAPSAASPYSAWAALKGLTVANNAPGLDPDNDGAANFLEFALNGNPLSGTSGGKVSGKVATVGTDQALTLTIPVRSVAAFGGGTEKFLTVDGVTYRVQGSDALNNWDLIVTEVTGTDAETIQSTLPQLDSGWFYRTFRSPGPVIGDPADFLRVKVESTN